MIIFKKIKWKNFLSTGNQFIEVDLTKSNTTLIIGKNGQVNLLYLTLLLLFCLIDHLELLKKNK